MKEHQYLLITLLVQICFCVFGMWQKPLWLDEAYSAVIARLSIAEIHQAMMYDAGPPLYYNVLHLWRILFGEEEVVLRLFSLLCAMGCTVLIYVFSYQYMNRCVAVYSSLLWAVSPLTVYYAIEVRNYTFLALLTLGYVYTLFSYLQTKKNKFVVISTALLILLLYTHNTALYLIPVTVVVLLFFNKNRKILIGAVFSLLFAMLAYTPWIGTLRHQLSQSELTIDWVESFWSLWMPIHTLTSYVPGGYNLAYMDMVQLPFGAQILTYLIYGYVLVFSVYYALSNKNKTVLLVDLFLISVLVISYLQSVILSPTYLAGRTDFFVFSLFTILIGYGISNHSVGYQKYGLYALMIISCCIVNGMMMFSEPAYSEWELIKTLKYQANDGDVIVCTGLTRPIVEYAMVDEDVTIISYPQDMEHHLAHLNEAWYINNVDLVAEANGVMSNAVGEMNGKKIILIWSGREINRLLQELVDSADYQHLTRNIYTHPKMGLSRLNEPLSLWILQ